MKNAAATNTTIEPKPKRVRGNGPFDEAKKAQSELDKLELKRRAVIDGLSDEAKVMLEALEDLRSRQPIATEPIALEVSTAATSGG